MAWRRPGDKPLSEPMIYRRIYASFGLNKLMPLINLSIAVTHFTNDFTHNSNLMEISFCCNSVPGHQIATKFCTLDDNSAVIPCTEYCSDSFIRIWLRANFSAIWIVIETSSVKWVSRPIRIQGPRTWSTFSLQGLYSLSDKTSYRQIPWNLEAVRDWMLQWSHRSEIWEASRRCCCRDASQISERLESLKRNLAALRFHEILRRPLCLSVYRSTWRLRWNHDSSRY